MNCLFALLVFLSPLACGIDSFSVNFTSGTQNLTSVVLLRRNIALHDPGTFLRDLGILDRGKQLSTPLLCCQQFLSSSFFHLLHKKNERQLKTYRTNFTNMERNYTNSSLWVKRQVHRTQQWSYDIVRE
jgi:hypothetical protein